MLDQGNFYHLSPSPLIKPRKEDRKTKIGQSPFEINEGLIWTRSFMAVARNWHKSKSRLSSNITCSNPAIFISVFYPEPNHRHWNFNKLDFHMTPIHQHQQNDHWWSSSQGCETRGMDHLPIADSAASLFSGFLSQIILIFPSQIISIFLSQITSIFLSQIISTFLSHIISIFLSQILSIFLSQIISIFLSQMISIYICAKIGWAQTKALRIIKLFWNDDQWMAMIGFVLVGCCAAAANGLQLQLHLHLPRKLYPSLLEVN